MRTTFAWLAIICVIAVGGLALWQQIETRARLDRRFVELRGQNGELARIRQENLKLAAAQPSAGELDDLRADHAAIPRLRAEIDAMQTRVRIAAEESAAHSPNRFAVGSKVLAADWRNAGVKTPRAALETALWAAAGGDIDTFASCLLLPEGRIRQAASALLDNLPAAMREQYGTPERLIAFLAIKDVPLGSALVTEWAEFKTPPSLVGVWMQLSPPDGKTKVLFFRLTNQSGDWKLIVPQDAITKYSAMLKTPPVTADKTSRAAP